MQPRVDEEQPDTPEAMALIAELESELAPMYPVKSRHGYSVEKLLREKVEFFVIRVDGHPAGCGGVQFFGDDFGELKRMFVRPRFRGLGLGRRPVEHIEQVARERRVPVLRLETGVHQHEAIGLYARIGFARIEAFAPYQPDPLSLFLEKRII